MHDFLLTWLSNGALKMLLTKQVSKLEQDFAEGKVTAYWAGTVLRIDVKPKA